jgi:hypothetical protein
MMGIDNTNAHRGLHIDSHDRISGPSNRVPRLIKRKTRSRNHYRFAKHFLLSGSILLGDRSIKILNPGHFIRRTVITPRAYRGIAQGFEKKKWVGIGKSVSVEKRGIDGLIFRDSPCLSENEEIQPRGCGGRWITVEAGGRHAVE